MLIKYGPAIGALAFAALYLIAWLVSRKADKLTRHLREKYRDRFE